MGFAANRHERKLVLDTRDSVTVPYRYVLLDFDHTLFDTDRSLELAFFDAMAAGSVDDPASRYATFQAINQALWKRVESQELTPPEVHLQRFVELVEALELDAQPAVLADEFAVGMGNHGELYPGARALLDDLAALGLTLALVTNGVSQIQRRRIERLDLSDYFDAVTISAEVDCAKPDPTIFDLTFRELGEPDRSTALMVGDSLSSDIAGGRNARIDTCWYNPGGAQVRGLAPTHVIESLGSLAAIVEP